MAASEKRESQRTDAAQETFDRIERDMKRFEEFRPLLERLKAGLFSKAFDVNALLKGCSTKGTVSSRFQLRFGDTLLGYLEKARLEVALRLLCLTDLHCRQVAPLVGYSSEATFSRAFSRCIGMAPGAFQKAWHAVLAQVGRPEVELHSLKLLDELRRSELEAVRARKVLVFFEKLARQMGAFIEPEDEPGKAEPCRSQLRYRELALKLWAKIENRPFAAQRAWVRSLELADAAFFWLLLRKVDQIGRNEPRRGMEVMELAKLHLEHSGELFGEEFSGLQALERAWRATCHRRLNDFEQANQHFGEAWEHWQKRKDERVEAEIRVLNAAFMMHQRRFMEALRELDRSISLAVRNGLTLLVVKAVLQRSGLRLYTGRPAEAGDDLRLARHQLARLNEPFLELIVAEQMAYTCVEAGKYSQALAEVAEARRLAEEQGERLTLFQTYWVEALAEQGLDQNAEVDHLLKKARSGFIELDAREYAALVSIDIGISCLRRGEYSAAVAMASSAILLLDSLPAGAEKLGAIDLLRDAIRANKVTLETLEKTRTEFSKALSSPTR